MFVDPPFEAANRRAQLHSPYRCRACSERFWVVSRKARTLTIAGIAACFAAVLVVAFVMVAPPNEASAVIPIAPPSEEVEVLMATPPRDAAPKAAFAQQVSPPGTPAASPSSAAPPAPVSAEKAAAAEGSAPAPAGAEKPLRSPAQPFVN